MGIFQSLFDGLGKSQTNSTDEIVKNAHESVLTDLKDEVQGSVEIAKRQHGAERAKTLHSVHGQLVGALRQGILLSAAGMALGGDAGDTTEKPSSALTSQESTTTGIRASAEVRVNTAGSQQSLNVFSSDTGKPQSTPAQQAAPNAAPSFDRYLQAMDKNNDYEKGWGSKIKLFSSYLLYRSSLFVEGQVKKDSYIGRFFKAIGLGQSAAAFNAITGLALGPSTTPSPATQAPVQTVTPQQIPTTPTWQTPTGPTQAPTGQVDALKLPDTSFEELKAGKEVGGKRVLITLPNEVSVGVKKWRIVKYWGWPIQMPLPVKFLDASVRQGKLSFKMELDANDMIKNTIKKTGIPIGGSKELDEDKTKKLLEYLSNSSQKKELEDTDASGTKKVVATLEPI